MSKHGRRAVVTGAAGFIGSHLCERLVSEGWGVVGIDSLTPYYDESAKRRNLDRVREDPGFEFVEADLRTADLTTILDGTDVVFHLAGQPGVRSSWSEGFGVHTALNIESGQRLLEAARGADLDRFVYASSSSVYGNAAEYPCVEGVTVPRPHSPYGVTKLAVEHLCRVYADNFGVPTVSLRYFTVYGPRQRPDMALHRLIESGLTGKPFPKFGDGRQLRDFTYVDDVVEATRLAGTVPLDPGHVMNVAGGAQASLDDLIGLVTDHLGPLPIQEQPAEPGDVRATGGSIERAARVLGWAPVTSLADGVARQVEWHRARAAG